MLHRIRRKKAAKEGVASSKPALIAPMLAAASAVLVQQGDAQVIDGVVVDSASLAPVAGAIVSLVHRDGRDLQRFVVDADGSFRFLLAGPGTYSLRAERLGMNTATVGGLDLGLADTVVVRLALRHLPFDLDGIEVSGERRCELQADVGGATHRVWEAARGALLALDASETASRYVYDLERHVRELEPGSLEVRRETRTLARSTDARPIRSRPVELLVSNGWVVDDGGGHRFFAPDAHALLSEPFLATHCIRLRNPDESRPELIGLEFRPLRSSPPRPDIEGVLWLARETGELQWLDFGYLGLSGLAAEHRSDQIGGRVEFLGMPDGGWIVTKWHIRMPIMVAERDRLFGVRRTRLAGIREEGGRVVRALRRGTGQVAYGELGGVLVGEVVGSRTGDRVTVVGLGIEAMVDEGGHFSIAGLPEGNHRLAHVRPWLLGLDREFAVADARVVAGDTTTIRVGPPAPEQVLAAACRSEEWDPATGVLLGDVSDGRGAALEGVEVVAEWVAVRDIGDRLSAEARTQNTTTDLLGEFRICGVPVDGYTISVTTGTGTTRVIEEIVLSPDVPIGWVSLRLAR